MTTTIRATVNYVEQIAILAMQGRTAAIERMIEERRKVTV